MQCRLESLTNTSSPTRFDRTAEKTTTPFIVLETNPWFQLGRFAHRCSFLRRSNHLLVFGSSDTNRTVGDEFFEPAYCDGKGRPQCLLYHVRLLRIRFSSVIVIDFIVVSDVHEGQHRMDDVYYLYNQRVKSIL